MTAFQTYFLRITLIVLILFAKSAISFGQSDEVYLTTGEFFKGEIISIGPELMLIKSEDRVFSVRRDLVKYVFRSQDLSYTPTLPATSTYQPPVYRFDTLDRMYLLELAGGLYTFSNFALSMQAIHWFRLDPHWSLGAMFSLDFSRYIMFRMGGQLKYSIRLQEDIASYFLGGVGVGPWATSFIDINDWQTINRNFSPIVQANIGGGIWYDTGMRIAFTGEGGLALTTFRLEETLGSWTGETRTQITNAVNVGPYFRVGMAF